ncbi:hypothetical protein ABZT51_39020 [Streptomyces sp. NPDC005373]|uniref:hypothetical protein n=1 Tax=Streptomyces sp. NPDC005373 TaxID=3156879 RepID=UPI0033B6A21C
MGLVWCEIRKPIPTPPEDVHRAAGRGRLKPGHHWLLYIGAVVFFFVVIPMMLIDKLDARLAHASRETSSSSSAPTVTSSPAAPRTIWMPSSP